MTYKQIEASREIRLWIGQVIVPAAMVVGVAMSNAEVRRMAKEKVANIKRAIREKFKKED